MKVWLACFLVLFAVAELFDWVQEVSFPLPIYILGGVFLAVISNYNELIGSYMGDSSDNSVMRSQESLQLNFSTQPEHAVPEDSSSKEVPHALETVETNEEKNLDT